METERLFFKWLPHYYSNDLVFGSVWFCIGSFISSIIPIIPLVDLKYKFFNIPNDTIIFDCAYTWIILICTGILLKL